MAERDRFVLISLEGGVALHLMLFGSRANVFLVEDDGRVVEAFQASAAHEGEPAPAPRAAPAIESYEDFRARWPPTGTRSRRLARARPLFDATLAAETLHRAHLPDTDADLDEAALRRVFDETRLLDDELRAPTPRLYRHDGRASVFALVELRHLEQAAWTPERFETTDAALRVFVRETLRDSRFHRRHDGLKQRLDRAVEKATHRLDTMLDQLSQPSRADAYERDAHLLMAQGHALPPGAKTATLPDLFEAGQTVTLRLDPALSAIENAQKLYDRARQSRQARTHAEARLVDAEAALNETARLRDALAGITTIKDLDAFAERERDALGAARADEGDRLPFRRYDVGHGYEAWVGKTAQQNDELTLRHARPFDLWMHARGVPGSHVVLRLPGRHSQPPPDVLDRAAALAAYHSKARGSSLVPVIVVPRKHVRKPKGATPGSVTVMRETVRLVAPAQPS